MDVVPPISIIIVSFNRLKVLRETLHSFRETISEPSFEMIVVDNGSTENVVGTIRREFPNVQVVENESNLGFGKANNIGAQHGRGEFLLFSNSDILLKANPLPAMVAALKNHQDVGIVGCQLRNEDGTMQPSFFRFPGLWMRFAQLTGLKNLLLKVMPALRFRAAKESIPGFVTGAFFMIRADLFRSIGGFDERYFMYVEDADLGYQVARRGLKSVLLLTDSVVHLGRHYEELDNPFVFHHMNRGQVLFYQKNFSTWKLKLLACFSLFAYTIRFLFRRGDESSRNEIRRVLKLYRQVLVGNGHAAQIVAEHP